MRRNFPRGRTTRPPRPLSEHHRLSQEAQAVRRLLTALLFAAAVSCLAGSAAAQEASASAPATTAAQPATAATAPATPPAQQEILVGVYVLSIGKLDISTGSFTVDFYLDLKTKDPKDKITDDAAALEFMNGRGTFEQIPLPGNTGNERFYRVLATLNTPIDLRRYPFDAQKMQIILENKTNGLESVKFIPAPKA
jgi:hypothetical protein